MFTMLQEILNHLSLLHIERDLSTKLWDSLDDVVLKFFLKHKNSSIVLTEDLERERERESHHLFQPAFFKATIIAKGLT